MARIEPTPTGYAVIKLGKHWLALGAQFGPQGDVIGLRPLRDAEGNIVQKRTRKEALIELRLGIVHEENKALRAQLAAVG